MHSTASERWAGWLALLAVMDGFLYAAAVVVLQDALLGALCLTLLGVLAIPILTALYQRLREHDGLAALAALLCGVVGAVGTVAHGGYDLSHALSPPVMLSPVLTELLSQGDPRGQLAFGFTVAGLLVFGGLMID